MENIWMYFFSLDMIGKLCQLPIQWNLNYDTGKVLLKKHKFHHLPGTIYTKSCSFSLLWNTTCLKRPQNLVLAYTGFTVPVTLVIYDLQTCYPLCHVQLPSGVDYSYMDLDVCCPRNAIKFNRSLIHPIATWFYLFLCDLSFWNLWFLSISNIWNTCSTHPWGHGCGCVSGLYHQSYCFCWMQMS